MGYAEKPVAWPRPTPSLSARSLVAKYSMLFSLNIPFLPLDFLFTKRVMIARPVKVDNMPSAVHETEPNNTINVPVKQY